MQKRYIGVMSGTSMDGVDVALCNIGPDGCVLEYALEYPFNSELKSDILECISGPATLKTVGQIDHRLGVLFADAVNAILKENQVDPESVEAIGLHGQTLWHEPDGEMPFSLQLGDANIVVARTGITTVADFRRRDIALGGQGAPFAPAFHAFAFGGLEKRCAVVNIGGIANITLLEDEVTGYDTGPGNMLIDGWVTEKRQEPFDKDGDWARTGTVHEELLERFLSDSYFVKEAPKSTGREYFSRAWLEEKLSGFESLEPQDVQSTLTELTARTITDEARKADPELLLICGGGVKNAYLMERLSVLMAGCEVAPTDDYGVSSADMEAMAFAWLAYKRMQNEPVALSSVTGAKEDGVLGGIYG
jgi:anhydro-N-acetylmuramic acid kinase